MTDLPRGWVELPIGNVCEVVGGSTPKTTIDAYWGGGIPWLTPDDLARDLSQYVAGGRRYLTKAGYESCSTQLMPAGAVLFTSRAPIGYVAIAKGPVCTNQGFKSFVPTPVMSSEYLYWYLVWATPSIRNLGSGTTFAEISGKVARTIPLRLPPRPEQDRIVAAIEEQFSRLDAARRLLVSSLDRIEGMRRAVLDQTHQSNCPQMSLAELASLITDGDHRPPARVASGVPHLTAKHIRNGRLVFEGCTFVSEEGYEQTTRRYLPQAGDVVITCVGTIGETAVVSGDVRFSADRNLAAVRLPDDHFRMTPQYLQMVLSSPSYRQRLTSASGSTAQPHLYLRDLRAIKVPVPDLDDQIEIVRETERGLSLADALAMTVKRSLFRSAQLRRSVLEQAFFGRLVPQDAGDEAATDLLARITAEGVSRPPSRRRRRE